MDFPTMKLHKRHTYGDLSNVPLTSAWGVEGSQRNNRGNSESSLRPRSSYQVCNGRAYTSPKQFHTAGAMRSKKQKQLRQKDQKREEGGSKHSCILLNTICFMILKYPHVHFHTHDHTFIFTIQVPTPPPCHVPLVLRKPPFLNLMASIFVGQSFM